MKAPYKRRSYPLIAITRQYRMLFVIITYALVLCGVIFLFLFVPDIALMQNESVDMARRAYAADRILTLHARLWPAVLALVCVIGLHSFREFTRIAGPLFRFKQTFEAITSGDLHRRIRLRRNDELKEEADAFNAMMDALLERISQYCHQVNDLADTAKHLNAAVSSDAVDCRKIASQLGDQIKRLQTDLTDERLPEKV